MTVQSSFLETTNKIRDNIFLQDLVEVVPKLKDEVIQKKFFEVLKNVGVENESDLLHVRELDLAPELFNKIQARKILNIWLKSKHICIFMRDVTVIYIVNMHV